MITKPEEEKVEKEGRLYNRMQVAYRLCPKYFMLEMETAMHLYFNYLDKETDQLYDRLDVALSIVEKEIIKCCNGFYYEALGG